MHAANDADRPLGLGDELLLPMHRRVVTQYFTAADGAKELRLFYGDKEISFDEPELFAFGESLAKQNRFAAGTARSWGPGYDWPRVQPLLEQLIEEGVLQHVDDAVAEEPPPDGARPSPLLPSACTAPRSWFDCEALMAELTGRPLELGWLELVVPIFRVAHMALDADGRQVGESNVFPPDLRLNIPTNWRTCIYPGTRFQAERPMNVTALKAMRQHWAQMMVALQQVRSAYLARFPEARGGWTVGHLERLATAVLALPTYQLMRVDGERRLGNGSLHPALSSMFRVTDGLRMTMHQMLFVPIGEPTLAPDAPMTSGEILAYAERNYSFHSEHGVCAGPQVMVEEFLAVLVDGAAPRNAAVVLDPEVQAALDDIEPALDYAFCGLQAYAAVFSLWPAMTRAYEGLLPLVEQWAAQAAPGDQRLNGWLVRLLAQVRSVRTGTFLANEQWRVEREVVYADMHAQCARGLGLLSQPLPSRRDALRAAGDELASQALADLLTRRFGRSDGADGNALQAVCTALMEYALLEQALLRAACEAQGCINWLLGRDAPRRAFSSADIDLHNQLQGAAQRRLPDLVSELEDVLRARIVIEPDAIDITDLVAPTAVDAPNPFGGMVLPEPRAMGTQTTRS